jgi:hypothetical protein
MTLSLQRSQVCPGQISRWAEQPEPAQLACCCRKHSDWPVAVDAACTHTVYRNAMRLRFVYRRSHRLPLLLNVAPHRSVVAAA